uniref:Uncharacterized protein n=1 Tax=Davidia involucrata TaxID=16924 RepID=A0A5B6YYL9_DAVIN
MHIGPKKMDEWVISRVFQKSGSGGSAAAGGGKKSRPNSSNNLYPEVSSPSSASLPPLLDSSPYATSAAISTDRESCSYDGNHHLTEEHVPCFSTINAANFNPHAPFDLPLPPSALNAVVDPSSARFARNVGVSAFPSLRSLQENLQLPFFFSAVAPPPVEGGYDMGGCSSVGNWLAPGNQRVDGAVRMAVGPTELDCMWNF